MIKNSSPSICGNIHPGKSMIWPYPMSFASYTRTGSHPGKDDPLRQTGRMGDLYEDGQADTDR